MTMKGMWIPDLPTDGSPIFQQILGGLERAISDGVLPVGSRLPPQRALAQRLGISVGTVTRAYEEADRRGLTVGYVGRGTFVAGIQANDPRHGSEDFIDLSMNFPPMIAAERLLVETWGRVRRRPDFRDILGYAPVEGLRHHRQLAATWLNNTAALETPHASRLVITSGCQAAMDLTMAHLCAPGDIILAEELTFSGMKALAEQRRYQLAAVTIDEQGLCPDDLERVAKATGARVLYTMPSLHNPTARTMSVARRKDIVAVARALGLQIVEDDNYAAYLDKPLATPPLTNLAPDVCYYVSGLSKSIAPGLRTGFVVAPNEASAAAVARGVRSSSFCTQSMGMFVAQQAIEDGAASQIIKENRRAVKLRGQQFAEALGLPPSPAGCAAPHVWYALEETEPEIVEARLALSGVKVTAPAVPRLEGCKLFGLRFCVAGTRNDSDFDRALGILKRVLKPQTDLAVSAVI